MKKIFIMVLACALMPLSALAKEDVQKVPTCPSDEAIMSTLVKFNKDITHDDGLSINDKNWRSSGIKHASPGQRQIRFDYSTLSTDRFFCTYNVETAVPGDKDLFRKSTFRIGRHWDKGESPVGDLLK